MSRNATCDAAFTMVEVMVSVVLMLLALGLLLSAFVSSKRSAALAQTYLTALQLVRSEAEQIQTNSYSNIVSSAKVLTNSFVEYRMSNSVTTYIPDKCKDIKIAVEWIAPSTSRRQAITNYIATCNPN